MNPIVRALSMTIGILLLLHIGAMAVDPVSMHAGADAPAPSRTTHTGHDAHAASGHAANTVVDAGACIGADGVASQSRVPLDPVAFVALLPAPVGDAIPAGSLLESGWVPPVLDGRDLRILLQVFLN